MFIADNTDSNNTIIIAILANLRPDLIIESRRSRYLGYIINLAIKAFLFGQDTTVFKRVTTLEDKNKSLDV